MKLRKVIGLLLVFILFSSLFGACRSTSPAGADFYNIRRISLRDMDKTYLLQMARAELTDGVFKHDEETYPLMYARESRGVFITLVRPHEAALTSFAMGDTIAKAVKQAAVEMKRLAVREDVNALKLRLDVIDESTDEKSRELGKRWSIDISRIGLIFQTDPVVAFLPQELRDWSVVDKKNRYSAKMMKRLIKHRALGRVLNDQFTSDKVVSFAQFTSISFMEGKDNALLPLYRQNRLDGFDATPERLLEAITAAGNYLKQAVLPDGKFEYLYFPQTSKVSRSYNELRHAGTVFSMMQIYEVNQDPELLEAAKRALGYLQRMSQGPDENDSKKYDWLAITHPEGKYAKLGGSGLALLAFAKYTQVTGDRQYMDLMRAFGRFVEYMVQPNGDVQMRYYHRPQDKDKVTKPVLYYPGEAFFGLAELYKLDDNNPRWQKVAERGIDFIADVRDKDRTPANVEHDHWMMYAINEWYRVKPKENHLMQMRKVTDAMMSKFIFRSEYPDYVGGYMKTPRTTQSACRLEGTAAVYKLAEYNGDTAQMDRLYKALVPGATFLMRNQYNEINTMFFNNPEKVIGGYQADYWNPEIQIDYVQHSTSALIAIRDIIMRRQAEQKAQ